MTTAFFDPKLFDAPIKPKVPSKLISQKLLDLKTPKFPKHRK
jgi:hypothetical protein